MTAAINGHKHIPSWSTKKNHIYFQSTTGRPVIAMKLALDLIQLSHVVGVQAMMPSIHVTKIKF